MLFKLHVLLYKTDKKIISSCYFSSSVSLWLVHTESPETQILALKF